MPLLKSLAFAAIPKNVNDPVQTRRAKLVSRLEEQLTLLQNPSHTRTRQRWVVADGEKRLVSQDHRQPLYRSSLRDDGSIHGVRFVTLTVASID
jgi:hypothetical protein